MKNFTFPRVLPLAATMATFGFAAYAADPMEAINGADIQQADPAIVELGNLLFFDARLSGDASTSCADCHDPNYGWGDGSELARGYPGTMHWRNSQTVVNMGFITSGFHWDAGLASLSDQVHDAMGAGFVANIDTVLGEERLRQIPGYVERFAAIWGEAPNQARIAESIAAYERSLISDDSPFDAYMRGESSALSASAMRGMELFNGQANCSACHNGALVSDQQFHNISVPPNLGLTEDALRQVTFRYLMRAKGLDADVYEGLDRDPGRYLSTQNPDDLGQFRTPPLRYLKYTAPYMHNGVFYTLEEVVEFYNIGGTQDVFGTKSPLIQPLGLNRQQKSDLVAFLESMSGSELKAALPELPEYAVQQFPRSATPITAASLKARAAGIAPAITQAPARSEGGLVLQPKPKGESNGLVLVPKNKAPETPASFEAPDTTETDLSQDANGERFVVVKAGDTLGTLAKRFYDDGKQFRKLFAANRDQLRSPNDVAIGMRLRVPE